MKTQPITIFFDLEETLIESWEQPNWLSDNAEAIKTFIKIMYSAYKTPSVQFGIMSWAIYDADEKDQFKRRFAETIEDGLGIKLQDDLILSMDDWMSLVMRSSGLRISRDEIFEMANKETILFWLLKASAADFPTGKIYLIDDAVGHNDFMESIEHDREIRLLNIKVLRAIGSGRY